MCSQYETYQQFCQCSCAGAGGLLSVFKLPTDPCELRFLQSVPSVPSGLHQNLGKMLPAAANSGSHQPAVQTVALALLSVQNLNYFLRCKSPRRLSQGSKLWDTFSLLGSTLEADPVGPRHVPRAFDFWTPPDVPGSSSTQQWHELAVNAPAVASCPGAGSLLCSSSQSLPEAWAPLSSFSLPLFTLPLPLGAVPENMLQTHCSHTPLSLGLLLEEAHPKTVPTELNHKLIY